MSDNPEKLKTCHVCKQDQPLFNFSGAQAKRADGLCKECVVAKEAKKNAPRGKAAVAAAAAAAASSSSPHDQDQDVPAAACAGCGKTGEFSVKCPICVELNIESRFCNKKCLVLNAQKPPHQKLHDEGRSR